MALAQRSPTGYLARVLLQSVAKSSATSTYASSGQSWTRILPSASITLPAFSILIPGLLADIWDGLLKAVPKKKTSHMKKRHRQLAGKALKDVNAVNSCPGCGKPKKAHTLCPYCVAEIQKSWKEAAKTTAKEGIAP